MYKQRFRDKPLEMHRQDDGEIQFTETGDALVDQWEADMAAGIEPDLSAALSPEVLRKLEATRGKSKGMTIKEVMERAGKESAKLDFSQRGQQTRRMNTFGE